MSVTMIALHKKHGALVRTGPNEVSVADLAAIKTIYGAGTRFRKSLWYSVWQGHRKFDLFAERDVRIHGEQRRLVSRAYSMDALKEYEQYVDDAVKVFLGHMSERQNQVVDMGNWVQLFAFGTPKRLLYAWLLANNFTKMSSVRLPFPSALASWMQLQTMGHSSRSKVLSNQLLGLANCRGYTGFTML